MKRLPVSYYSSRSGNGKLETEGKKGVRNWIALEGMGGRIEYGTSRGDWGGLIVFFLKEEGGDECGCALWSDWICRWRGDGVGDNGSEDEEEVVLRLGD